MNICIVAPDKLIANKGGLESVCYNLALIFGKKEGVRCFQLFTKTNDAPDIPGISYQRIPETYQQQLDKDIEETRRFIRENDIDILWNHSSNAPLTAYLHKTTQGTKAKIISIIHNTPKGQILELRDRHDLALYRMRHYGELLSYLLLLLKYPLSLANSYRKARLYLRLIVNNSDKLALLSDCYRKEFLHLAGMKENKKVTHVTNPILPLQERYRNTEKQNILLVAARHAWKHKRLDRIINIWHKIENSFPTWELVMLGDGADHGELIKHAQRLKLQRISFPGQTDPQPYYAKAKIFCMTSGWEGLPMALLEAQQHGCVPICYESFSALLDIINNGETGYRIPAFKEKLYIEKLTDMMSDEQALQHMSENCREHAKNFDIEKIAETWISLFKETLNTPS